MYMGETPGEQGRIPLAPPDRIPRRMALRVVSIPYILRTTEYYHSDQTHQEVEGG